MQQGIITKIESKFMIIKTSDSDIERIKSRPDVQVGDSVTFTKKDIYHGFNRMSYKQFGASLSILIMMAIIGGVVLNTFTNNQVYGVVSFDVNPSIQVEINKKDEVLNITQNTYSSIIPENYQSMPLEEFLLQLTANAQSENLLSETETILIGYVPIDHSNTTNASIESFKSKQSSYKVIVITQTEDDLEAADKDTLSIGRYYLKVQLETLDIEVEETDDFIQDATDIIEELLPDESEPVDDASEETTNTDDTTTEAATSDDNTTSSNTDAEQSEDETLPEDSTETEDEQPVETEEPVEEEALSSEELEALKTDIASQEQTVDDTYNDYIVERNKAQTLEQDLNAKKAEINEQETMLSSQQEKKDNNTAGMTSLKDEQLSLSNRINIDKVSAIEVIEQEKSDGMSEFDDEKQKRDDLNDEADQYKDEAKDGIASRQNTTINELEDLRSDYEQIKSELESSATADHSQEIEIINQRIDEIDGLISTVASLSGTISSDLYQNTASYNNAYNDYDKLMDLSKEKTAEADEYDDIISEGLTSVEVTYTTKLADINAAYADDEARLQEVNNLLSGLEKVNSSFDNNIQSIETLLETLRQELDEITSAYNIARSKQSNAYATYQEAIAVLDELKGQLDE